MISFYLSYMFTINTSPKFWTRCNDSVYSFILIHLYLKHPESFAFRIFTEDEINEIRSTTFKDVILSATDIPSDSVQDKVFVWKTGILHALVVDSGFPRGGKLPRWLRQPIILQYFCQTLHKNERIWTRGARVPGAPLDPPQLWICAKNCFQKGFVLGDGQCTLVVM